MGKSSGYKKEDVIISIESLDGLGSYTLEGYGEGEFLTIEPDGDGYTETPGSHQEVTRNRMDLPGATWTLRLHGGSESNKALYDLWAQDKDTGSSLFAITVKDVRSGGKEAYSEDAYVKNVPSLAFGDGVQEVEWVIRGMHTNIKHAGQTSLV